MKRIIGLFFLVVLIFSLAATPVAATGTHYTRTYAKNSSQNTVQYSWYGSSEMGQTYSMPAEHFLSGIKVSGVKYGDPSVKFQLRGVQNGVPGTPLLTEWWLDFATVPDGTPFTVDLTFPYDHLKQLAGQKFALTVFCLQQGKWGEPATGFFGWYANYCDNPFPGGNAVTKTGGVWYTNPMQDFCFEEIGYLHYPVGDANEDGSVNMADVTKVQRIILALDPPTVSADVDINGVIDMADVVKIERIILGLP